MVLAVQGASTEDVVDVDDRHQRPTQRGGAEMTTTTAPASDPTVEAFRGGVPPGPPTATYPVTTRSLPISLLLAGIITALTAAWGGIVPFVGPIFNFSADGSGSWEWNLAHALLGLVPGAAAVLGGLVVLSIAPLTGGGRGRLELAVMGLFIAVCGAWFVIGYAAWPVIENSGGRFVLASPLMNLAHVIGYAFGPGVLLVGCGAFVFGWAARHRGALMAYPAYPQYQPPLVPPAPETQPPLTAHWPPAPPDPLSGSQSPATAPPPPTPPEPLTGTQPPATPSSATPPANADSLNPAAASWLGSGETAAPDNGPSVPPSEGAPTTVQPAQVQPAGGDQPAGRTEPQGTHPADEAGPAETPRSD
jgi:hypothetical protein